MIKQISELFWNGFFHLKSTYQNSNILNFPQQISIWLALDPVSKETCVKYWKGSQKKRMQHTVKSFAGDDTYTEGKGVQLPNVDDLVVKGEAELLEWDLEPGKWLIAASASLIESKQFSTPFCSVWQLSANLRVVLCGKWFWLVSTSGSPIKILHCSVFLKDSSKSLNFRALKFYWMNIFCWKITGDGHRDIQIRHCAFNVCWFLKISSEYVSGWKEENSLTWPVLNFLQETCLFIKATQFMAHQETGAQLSEGEDTSPGGWAMT